MLTMSTASQEGPGLAKVYPGLRFFGTRISLTDCFAEPGARLIIYSKSARRARYAAPQIIPTSGLTISTFA